MWKSLISYIVSNAKSPWTYPQMVWQILFNRRISDCPLCFCNHKRNEYHVCPWCYMKSLKISPAIYASNQTTNTPFLIRKSGLITCAIEDCFFSIKKPAKKSPYPAITAQTKHTSPKTLTRCEGKYKMSQVKFRYNQNEKTNRLGWRLIETGLWDLRSLWPWVFKSGYHETSSRRRGPQRKILKGFQERRWSQLVKKNHKNWKGTNKATRVLPYGESKFWQLLLY